MKRQNTTQQKPRLFQLVRHTDVSGVRGTGTLADGVEWPDGAVILRWRGRWPVTSVWEGGLDALLAVHGQGGRTQVHWLPAIQQAGLSPPGPAAPARVALSAGVGGAHSTEQGGALWLPAASVDGLCARCGRSWPCLGCDP
jgi:hypothetical protein